MNISIIRFILGTVLKIEAVLFVLPIITALIYGEKEGFAYLLTMLICGVLGIAMTICKPKNNVFYLKEGCVTTALSWILMAAFGGLPFVFSGEIPNFIYAMFEATSGFTTTGASVVSDVEALSHATLIWRSFTHWIGGMGVLVFLLAIIPLTGGSNMHLMKAESPGPSVEKIVPKVRYTARILYLIYIALTVLQLILLLIGKMPLFEALCTALGTAGTGGFGFKNDGMASYSPYLQWVITIFMILFGVNFNAYYLILYKKFKSALKMEEVRSYFIIIVVAIAIVFVSIYDNSVGAFKALTDASFQVASLITTTGYSTADFNQWSEVAKVVLLMIMFIGACAGSTGGGMKVSRIVIMVKTIFKELNSYLHPKSVKKIKMDDKPIEREVVRSINVYIGVFAVIFALSLLLVSIEGKSFVTNFSAVTATINNIGPGLDMVGPMSNFGHFNPFTIIVLTADMLIGRLELFPMLVLFYPPIWKDAFTAKVREVKRKKLKVEKNRG